MLLRLPLRSFTRATPIVCHPRPPVALQLAPVGERQYWYRNPMKRPKAQAPVVAEPVADPEADAIPVVDTPTGSVEPAEPAPFLKSTPEPVEPAEPVEAAVPIHHLWARQVVDETPPLTYMDTQATHSTLVAAGFTPTQASDVLAVMERELSANLLLMLTTRANKRELAELDYALVARIQEMKMDMDRRRDQFKTRFVQEMEIYKTHLMQQDSQSHLMVMEHVGDSELALTEIRIANNLKTEERQEKIHTINSRVSTNIALALKGDVADLRWDLIKRGLLFIALIFFAGIVGHREFQKIQQKQAEEEKKKNLMPSPMLKVHEPTDLFEEDGDGEGDYRKYDNEYE